MSTSKEVTWLDTETKAFLQQTPPEKLAPATTETFGIVVLSLACESENARRLRAYERVLQSSQEDAKLQCARQPPFILKFGLAMPDALLAQFELISCDIVSVFIADTVLLNADDAYLIELYRSLLSSPEFALETIRVDRIGNDPLSIAFVDQFLGGRMSNERHEIVATRKKARIMIHWATKIGAIVTAIPRKTIVIARTKNG